MNKNWLASLVLVALIIMTPIITMADEAVKVMIDGSYITMNNQPQIIDNRIYMPVRELSEALGFEVEWIDSSRTASLTKPVTPIEEKLPTIVLNGENTTWPYWYENDQLYMEYHDAVAMMSYCTTSRIITMKYYPDSKRFVFNDNSVDLVFKLKGDFKVINVSSIDRNMNSIGFTFDPATNSVVTAQ